MMGLHFFMPAHLIPLVEVVRSVHTDVAHAEQVGEIMTALGKRPVQVKKDVIGFLGNRIQGALMREALWLIEEGVASPEDIDATVRLSFGFRYAAAGPIVQKEHSGWDTTCAVAKIIWPDLNNAKGPPPILQKNVDEGRIGFKTKGGFFKWDDESIAKERARYERALRKCLEIFKEEGIV
jgi:3-hydroxybutyryl-CoA dehydrogenase